MKLISLFSGAGCFDYGFEASGFETLLTTDIDQDSCNTISQSRPNWLNLCLDIADLNGDLIEGFTGIKRYDLDLLIGGPPCQPFSKSAYGSKGNQSGMKDSRGRLFKDYLRILEELCPAAFVIENVPQFVSGKNSKILSILESSLQNINQRRGTNYKISVKVINTASYGVPQLRNRVFIVGSREGNNFFWPEVTHFSTEDVDLGMQGFLTAKDAFKGLSFSRSELKNLTFSGKYADFLRTIPPGMNYLWHTDRGGGDNAFKWRSRFWNFLLKLSPDLPSWTIAANPGMNIGPFHWNNRRLHQRELARLQTIPDDVQFFGSSTSVRRQIGNGVPSAVGELLGREIQSQLLGIKPTNAELKLLKQMQPTKSKREIQRKLELSYNL